jgi:hypothetical protein
MTRYVWKGDHFADRATGEPMQAPERVCRPAVLSDIEYMSPLSLTQITSRSQRREEMKIHNVREVDPSEHKPVYRQKKYAVANKGEWNPDAGKPTHVNEGEYRRLSKSELPERLRRSIA